jgi:hypothetical protein
MSIETWETMPRNQNDPETIEELVDRKILEHDENSEAHLNDIGSLQNHKSGEIIDHPANSIVNDKIGDSQITPNQFAFGDVFLFNGIQTLDCWSFSHTGAGSTTTLPEYGKIVLVTGVNVGDKEIARISPGYVTMWPTDNQILECRLNYGSDYNSDAAICMGASDPFADGVSSIGFRYKESTESVYAFYNSYYSGSWHKFEYLLFADVFTSQIYRIEVNSVAKTIKWLVNGIVKKTVTYGTQTILGGNSYVFTAGLKRTASGADTALHVWNLFFTKLHTQEE